MEANRPDKANSDVDGLLQLARLINAKGDAGEIEEILANLPLAEQAAKHPEPNRPST